MRRASDLLFDLPLVAVNTTLLLLSSITRLRHAGDAPRPGRRHPGLAGRHGLLGLGFLSLEIYGSPT